MSVRHLAGLRGVGYVDGEGGCVGPLLGNCYFWRLVLVVRDGDERLNYRPMEAVAAVAA